MTQKRTVDEWYFLLSRLHSLDKESKDPIKLVASIDKSFLREDFLTPHKKQKWVVKSISNNLLSLDFNDEVLVDVVDPSSFTSSCPGLLDR